ncbi:MAG: hypothetical protein JWR38_197 [Mucilaginibacter sp.]|nr:hypothetical protein [Mucilaginibacter sp.]
MTTDVIELRTIQPLRNDSAIQKETFVLPDGRFDIIFSDADN